MKEKVVSILKGFGVEEAAIHHSNAHLTRDLGLDSLDTVDLIVQLERTFGIRIPDEDYKKLRTLEGVYTYLREEQHIDVAMAA